MGKAAITLCGPIAARFVTMKSPIHWRAISHSVQRGTPQPASLTDSSPESDFTKFAARQLPATEAVGPSVGSSSADTKVSDAASVAFAVIVPDFRAL